MTLTLKIVEQFFIMTHCFMTIHHQNKFGQKWVSGSGDIVRTRSDTRTGLQTDSQTPPPHKHTHTHTHTYSYWGGGINNKHISYVLFLSMNSQYVLKMVYEDCDYTKLTQHKIIQ